MSSGVSSLAARRAGTALLRGRLASPQAEHPRLCSCHQNTYIAGNNVHSTLCNGIILRTSALPGMSEIHRCPLRQAPSPLRLRCWPCCQPRRECRVKQPRCCGAGSTRGAAVAASGRRCGWSGPTHSSPPCGTPGTRNPAAWAAGVNRSHPTAGPAHRSTASPYLELCGVVRVVHGHVTAFTQLRESFPEGLVAALQRVCVRGAGQGRGGQAGAEPCREGREGPDREGKEGRGQLGLLLPCHGQACRDEFGETRQ